MNREELMNILPHRGNMLLLEPSDSIPVGEPMVVVSTMAHEELVIAFALDNGERLWAYSR